MPATIHPASQPVAAPSPTEIRRRCLEIQQGWSEDTRRKRSVFKVEAWMLRAVEVMLPEDITDASYMDDLCGRVA